MPTIRAKPPEYVESDLATNIVVASGATGSHNLAARGSWEFVRDSLSGTGFFRPILLEGVDEFPVTFATFSMSQKSLEVYGFAMIAPGHDIVAKSNEPSHHYIFISNGSVNRASQQDEILACLSPLVRNQVEQVPISANPKVLRRLSQFGIDRLDLEQVLPSTIAAVNRLVNWLCQQSDTVSATVSNDGMLSIATVFPNDVRLYVEIERGGSTGAAVTRERRYARDIFVNTVVDLSPEVILAAVESI